MKHLAHELAVAAGARFKLSNIDPADTHGMEKDGSDERLEKNCKRLSVLQYQLYAGSQRALLGVLQGIDAGGKDGTITHVMSGMNPQGVTVTAFKVPEGAEKRHDYLWRVEKGGPGNGQGRSFEPAHSVDVGVVRVLT